MYVSDTKRMLLTSARRIMILTVVVLFAYYLPFHLLMKLMDLTHVDYRHRLSVETRSLKRIGIVYSTQSRNKNERSSKFRCVGRENDIAAPWDRLCVFNDICYSVQENRFEFYPNPHTFLKPIFFDKAKGMLTQFSEKQDGQGFVTITHPRAKATWAPFVMNTTYPSVSVTRLTRLHALWKESVTDYNIGHMIWEDFGQLFYSMERMHEFDEEMVVMHATQIPQHPLFGKWQQHVMKVITPHPLVALKSYAQSFNTTHICFDRFIVGGPIFMFNTHEFPYVYHEVETLVDKWRSKIIQYHGFDPEYIPKTHLITITNKTESFGLSGYGRRRIYNLKEIVDFIKQAYPRIPVRVVEWHRVPFPEQIDILLRTTILITPQGGVAARVPFLPRGAHTIITDYYVDVPRNGNKAGESIDGLTYFHAHFPHVRKINYQVYGPQDYRWDYPGAHVTESDASIIIKTKRLALLLEKALEDMEP
jgi:hypothetical protein